jgi:Na+-transporting methylmalonyl-CoA/oxaloacetate decarboxylase gamma subunit
MDDLRFGLQLTVVGMGLVFGLLGLLWLALTVAARLEGAAARRVPSGDGRVARAGPVEIGGAGAAGLEPGALAAIAIAVVAHAHARRRQAAPEMRSVQPGSLLHASRWISNGRATQTRGWTRGR